MVVLAPILQCGPSVSRLSSHCARGLVSTAQADPKTIHGKNLQRTLQVKQQEPTEGLVPNCEKRMHRSSKKEGSRIAQNLPAAAGTGPTSPESLLPAPAAKRGTLQSTKRGEAPLPASRQRGEGRLRTLHKATVEKAELIRRCCCRWMRKPCRNIPSTTGQTK